MSLFSKDKFFVQINDNVFSFTLENENIVMSKYLNQKLILKKRLISSCKKINDVILGKDENISLIFSNYEDNLMLCILEKEDIKNCINLKNSIVDIKDIKIFSVNNSLNLFYITEEDYKFKLNFRTISKRLVMSKVEVLDYIEFNNKSDYKVVIEENNFLVAYLREGLNNSLGYKKFNFESNAWDDFILLDSSESKIQEFNLVIQNGAIAYSYINYKNRLSKLYFGIHYKGNIEKNCFVEKDKYKIISNIYFINNNLLKIINVTKDDINIKEFNEKLNLLSDKSLNIKGESFSRKYPFSSTKINSINEVIELETEEYSVLLTNSYFENIDYEDFKDNLLMKKYLKNNTFLNDIGVLDNDEKYDNNDDDILIDRLVFEEFKQKRSEQDRIIRELYKNVLNLEDNKKELMFKINDIEVSYNKKDNEMKNLINRKNNEIHILNEKIKSLDKKYIDAIRNNEKVIEDLNISIKDKEDVINILSEKDSSNLTDVKNELNSKQDELNFKEEELKINKMELEFKKDELSLASIELKEKQEEIQIYESEVMNLRKENNILNIKIQNMSAKIEEVENKQKDSILKRIFK